MTVTSDRHHMNVNDLHKFEKNITGWFQQWDRQRNLTTSRFAQDNRPPAHGSPNKTNGNSEMHTKALLDCKTSTGPGKQNTRNHDSVSFKSRGVSAFAAKLRSLRCQSISSRAKKNAAGVSTGGRKLWTITSRSSFSRLTPLKETDQATISTSEDNQRNRPELERRGSSHSNMYSLLLSLKEDVTPNRQRRFPRTNSLRRFVTLREHRKKCEMGLIKVDTKHT